VNFTGVICIGQGIWSWTTARVDYDGKIDIGVGRDPVAFSAMILLLIILWISVILGPFAWGHCAWLAPEQHDIVPVADGATGWLGLDFLEKARGGSGRRGPGMDWTGKTYTFSSGVQAPGVGYT
jgi:hypothetical protein